jgi:hypothetical protein
MVADTARVVGIYLAGDVNSALDCKNGSFAGSNTMECLSLTIPLADLDDPAIDALMHDLTDLWRAGAVRRLELSEQDCIHILFDPSAATEAVFLKLKWYGGH